MDLIYTDKQKIDQGVLGAYTLDLSFGDDKEENNFELILGNNEPMIEEGAVVYIEGTEYGGMVDGLKSNSGSETTTFIGRTWHGILNSKVIQPDSGENYFAVSGDAHEVLSSLIARIGLSGLFVAASELSGVNIKNYQFNRYCMAYDGIRAMLAANGAKLKIKWENRSVMLYAEPIADYTNDPVDGDIAPLSVERHGNKVNHLVCLGRGELANREFLHLYIDQWGRIGDVQYYTGLDEVADVYDLSNTESIDELRNSGIERLSKLRNNDKIEVSINEGVEIVYDIGDMLSAIDYRAGNTAKATVIQKIVKINNGTISVDYKTGR